MGEWIAEATISTPLLEQSRKLVARWFSDLPGSGLNRLSENVTHPDEPLQLNGAMLLIWLTRDDLQEAFPLITSESRTQFAIWCAQQGRVDYDLFKETIAENFLEPLLKPCGPALPFSSLLILFHASLPQIKNKFNLLDQQGRRQFLAWFLLVAFPRIKKGVRVLADWQIAWLAEPISPQPAAGEPPITRLMDLVYYARPDIQRMFDLNTPIGRHSFCAWFQEHSSAEFPHLAEYLTFSPPRTLSVIPPKTALNIPHQLGATLIGYAFAELGIGEDVRMAAHSLAAHNYLFNVYNFQPGDNVPQNDHRLNNVVAKHFDYPINIFCMTAVETARAISILGRQPFQGRFNIGYWPWELPRWPDYWSCTYDCVDEIWVSSRFTQESFSASSSIPVIHMPMAVEIAEISNVSRSEFGLPADDFLFVFSFDGLSYLARKNPLAVVTAFQRAFPRGDEPVGLVIKVMNVTEKHFIWQSILKSAATDSRIHIISQCLSRAKLNGLYRKCDCFISLHRAEGFGRGIAEAMLLGKPVIVTGFSGNLDFTNRDTALLVDYRLIPINPGEYPWSEGQYWADPDIDEAAAHMVKVATHSEFAKSIGEAGRLWVAEHHAPAVIGKRYLERL